MFVTLSYAQIAVSAYLPRHAWQMVMMMMVDDDDDGDDDDR